MNYALEFEKALNSNKPFENLHELAVKWKAQGMSKDEMYTLFEHYGRIHQEDEDETKYDAIADTMDFIVGWCLPQKRLFD